MGDAFDGLVQSAATLVTGQQGRGEQGEILAAEPLLGLGQRAFERLAQLILRHDLVEFGVNRLGTLRGQDLHRLGQRQPGPNRVGQRDHRVGQLVLDATSVALGHPAQQVPRPANQKNGYDHGKKEAVQSDPKTEQRAADHDQPEDEPPTQVSSRHPHAAQLLGHVALDPVEPPGAIAPPGQRRGGDGRTDQQARYPKGDVGQHGNDEC